jgi:hypothetical protein
MEKIRHHFCIFELLQSMFPSEDIKPNYLPMPSSEDLVWGCISDPDPSEEHESGSSLRLSVPAVHIRGRRPGLCTGKKAVSE